MKLNDLNNNPIWFYFDQITKTPRPSKKEEKIVQFLMDFAEKHHLQAEKDQANNVLIRKKATSGNENLKTVILQSHIDMVCEKNNDLVHNFETDPIKTNIDGDWIKAQGTTLGADDGIGVAASLAILASNDIQHGDIECLFTTDEETGLTGAYAVQKDFLTGSILLNLDSEEEGEFYIGCAGGKNTLGTFKYNPIPAPENYYWFNVEVNGLNGGHSGGEIHKGLGNANQILIRYLWTLREFYPIAIESISGGNLSNAIAREAQAVIGIPWSLKEKTIIELNLFLNDLQSELQAVEPKVKIIIETAEAPIKCIDKETTDKLIDALYACPHGVLGMSHDIPGLVETSTNLASIKMKEDNNIVVTTSQRSSTESLKKDAINKVTAVLKLAGASISYTEGYPGWKPNPDSEILKISTKVYEGLFGNKPEVKAIHAGLECGLFLQKYPNLDMISFGPTILGAHSPEERLQISSVDKWWEFLIELLKQIPAK